MASAKAPNGDEKTLRVIVFSEENVFVAQCLEYDVAAQSNSIEAVIDRLELTLEAEFSDCESNNVRPRDKISPAPVYYHNLWENQYAKLERRVVPQPDCVPLVEYALAMVA